MDSYTKWPSHDLEAQTMCCAQQALSSARESQLCVEEVLLIWLRVRLVMGERDRDSKGWEFNLEKGFVSSMKSLLKGFFLLKLHQ